MEVYFAPSFLKVFKKFDSNIKEQVRATTDKTIDFYESGQKTTGLGIKHLRGTLWEARVGIKFRLVYELSGNQLTFIIAGSHDDVKNYLRR